MIIKKVFEPNKGEEGLSTIYEITQVSKSELIVIKEFMEKYKLHPGMQILANVISRTIKEALNE